MRQFLENRWISSLAAPLVLLIFTTAFVSINVSRHEAISPIDEYVYLDYTAQVLDIGIMPRGTETGDLARNYISCLGVAGYGDFNPSACGSGDYSDDSKYPYAGKSSADIYSPLYFGVSALVARLIISASGLDFLHAARLSGILWLGASALFVYFALRRLRMDTLSAFSAPLILVSSLAAWWSATFISTDVTAIFAGGALFYGLVWYLQRGSGGWLLILLSMLLTLLKFQNVMAVAVVAIVIALSPKFPGVDSRILKFQPSTMRNRLGVASLMIASSIITQAIWVFIHEKMALAAPVEQGVANHLTPAAIMAEATKFISGMAWGASAAEDISQVTLAVTTITTWVIIGGCVAATLSRNGLGFLNSFGFTWITIAMLSAPLLGVTIFFASGFYFHLPARYGLSLLPIGLAISFLSLGKNAIWRFVLFLFAIFAACAGVLPLMHQ